MQVLEVLPSTLTPTNSFHSMMRPGGNDPGEAGGGGGGGGGGPSAEGTETTDVSSESVWQKRAWLHSKRGNAQTGNAGFYASNQSLTRTRGTTFEIQRGSIEGSMALSGQYMALSGQSSNTSADEER